MVFIQSFVLLTDANETRTSTRPLRDTRRDVVDSFVKKEEEEREPREKNVLSTVYIHV